MLLTIKDKYATLISLYKGVEGFKNELLSNVDIISVLNTEVEKIDTTLGEMLSWIADSHRDLEKFLSYPITGFLVEIDKCEQLEEFPKQHFPVFQISWDEHFNPTGGGLDQKERIAAEFSPLEKIWNSKIHLDEKVIHKDGFLFDKPFRLLDVVEAILTEITFFGSTLNREKEFDSINELLKEINEGERNE